MDFIIILVIAVSGFWFFDIAVSILLLDHKPLTFQALEWLFIDTPNRIKELMEGEPEPEPLTEEELQKLEAEAHQALIEIDESFAHETMPDWLLEEEVDRE